VRVFGVSFWPFPDRVFWSPWIHGPGNWATDIAGGSRFAYQLISVLMISNLIAILVQALAARLGIATQMDLAQACKIRYSRRTTIILWVLCEIAIAACDLAEVIGSAIALNLLFHIPSCWRLPDGARCAGHSLPPEQRLPLSGGRGGYVDWSHWRVLPD